MRLKLLFRTILYLHFRQIYYQIQRRIFVPSFQIYKINVKCNLTSVVFLEKINCYNNGIFSFLNIQNKFDHWSDTSYGMLWAYNLNYMDWLNQSGMSFKEGAKWIDLFINDISKNCVGLDPYPIALRGINWIKFMSRYYSKMSNCQLEHWCSSLYSQYRLLEKRLEYHLLGNHLLEDAYSLYIASLFFGEERMYKRYSELLLNQLDEQILNDGAHYEQSPMYHCILLDRLLDCYNFSTYNLRFEGQDRINRILCKKAQLMLGHLSSIIYNDHSFPLLNDSAEGIAPLPDQLFEYAKRLGLDWKPIPLKECGYRKMYSRVFEVIVDVGNIMASYQPGHSHADTFSYELRIFGKPFIIDTGISTYNKTNRRQYERGTMAHNTVSVNGKNSSEVWGGFRIGRRAKVTILKDSHNDIEAYHNGFGSSGTHFRRFRITDNCFGIEDSFSGDKETISVIHLAPDVEIISYDSSKIITNRGIIEIQDALKVEIVDDEISYTYNCFNHSKTMHIYFFKHLSYQVKLLVS